MLQQFISIKTTMERTKVTLSTYKVKKRKIFLQIHTNLCHRCTISICNTSLILWTNNTILLCDSESPAFLENSCETATGNMTFSAYRVHHETQNLHLRKKLPSFKIKFHYNWMVSWIFYEERYNYVTNVRFCRI